MGEHEAGDDHRHHAAGVHELGEQEGEERRQHAERALPLRIVEPTADEDDQAAGEQAGGDAARVGTHEAARDRERSRRHRADRYRVATPNRTSAVPSLIRLSARSVVSVRRGRRFARPATAAASVGASTAPSTHAARGSMPSARPA